MNKKEGFKSGFVSIIGRPNVGKSTLMNRIVGQKVAIMSDVPQTTRNKIQGVVTSDDSQIVFIDTPGIHKPQTRLNDFMLKSAYSTFNEVDLVLFMVNAAEKRGAGEILFTSMDHDGTKNGFANEALAKLSVELNIPIIASGGAGNNQHFIDTFVEGKADAALAASVFHFKEIEINDLKKELQAHNIPVRL